MASGSNNSPFSGIETFEILHQCHRPDCTMVYTTPQAADACKHQLVPPQLQMLQDSPRHGGARNLDLWNQERTEALLSLVRDNYHRLNSKLEKSNPVWSEICLRMQGEMPGVTRDQVQTKWKNLKAKYIKFKDKMSKSRTLPPPCLGILDAILGSRPSTCPMQRMSLGSIVRSSQPGPSKPDESQAETSELGQSQPGPANHPQPELPKLSKHEASHPVSPLQPSQEPDEANPADVEEVLKINITGGIPSARRRLRGQRRLRPDTHGRLMEERAREYVEEVRRHNSVMEQMMRELVDAHKQIAEEYRRRGRPPE